MNSPIAWIGGKRILAKQIISLMPEHSCYVEVFGGGGWVLFRKEPSKVEVYNDLNSDLVNLFRVVRGKLSKFKQRQHFLLASREDYYKFMQDIKAGKFRSDIDRAIAFYYCIKNSFGSGIFTGFGYAPSQKPKYRGGLDKIDEASQRLKDVYIDNLPFEKLLKNWDRPGTLFYCDPPYVMLLEKKGRAYYQHSFTEEDHVLLRDRLKALKGKVILSYDDHPLIRKLYRARKFRIHEVKVNYSMNQRPGSTPRHGSELIITNFQTKAASTAL